MANVQQIVRDYLLRARSEGVAQVESEARRLGQATDSLAVKTENVSRSQVSVEKALERTALRMSTSYKMTSQLAQAEATLERARVQGLQGTSAYRAAQDGLAEAQRRSTTAANDNHGAFDRLGNMLTRRLIYGVIIAQAKQAAVAVINLNTELAKTGDIATRIGSGGQTFQGFSFAAEVKGVQGFPEAMLALNKEVDRAKAGLGDLATLFRANGLTVKDTQDAFLKISDLVKNAATEAAKFSILEQAGLPASREFVRLMEQGAVEIRKQSDEARKLTDAQLNSAKEIDDRWNAMWANFKREAKGAIVDFTSWVDKLDDRWARFHSETIMPIFRDIKSSNMGAVPVTPVTRGADLPDIGGSKYLGTVNGRTNNPARTKELLGLEQQRIGILGQMATVEQQVRSVEIGIALARLNNVNVTKDEERALLALARAQAIGITQIRTQIDAQKIEGATLNMSAADALAYRAVWEKIYEARRAGHPLNEQQIRDLQSEAEELRKIAQQNERFKQLTDLGKSFASSMLDAAMSSKSLSEGLKMSLDSLAKMAANAALKNLLEGDFAMAAIDATIAVASKLSAGLFDDSQQKAADAAKASWSGMKDQMNEFIRASSGFDLGKQAQAVHQLKKSYDDLWVAAMKAGDAANAERVASAFVHGIWNQMDAFANQIGGTKSDIVTQMDDLRRGADDLIQSMKDVNFFSAEAGATIEHNLNGQLAILRDRAQKGLIADINEAQGKGFVNELNDLFDRVSQLKAESNVTGVDTTLIDRFLQIQAQKIVDGADIAGTAFDDLIRTFPNLTGLVHESTSALEKQAEAQKQLQQELDAVARSIVDYVASFRTGTESTLSPSARLALAQSNYNSQFALAQGGNLEAQKTITQYADPLIKAIKDNFASGGSTQIEAILSQLLTLPALQQSSDPVVQALLDVQQKIGVTNSSLVAGGQTAAQLLATSITRLDTSITNLSNVVIALVSGGGWLSSLNNLQVIARDQLQLLNAQLAGSTGLIVGIPSSAGGWGGAGSYNDKIVNNTMLLALNKMVINTWATAENTKLTASRILTAANNTSGSGGTFSGVLAMGGIIPPYGLALVSEHSAGGGRFLRAGSEPITVSPFGPSNDNSRVEAKLDQLIRVLSAVGAAMVNAETMTGREVRDAVVGAISEQTETIKSEGRQARNNPKAA